MAKPRKKTARKASASRASKRGKKVSAKKVSAKSASKSKGQLKSIEKVLVASMKKALDVCKRDAKKATTQASRLGKKLAAADKKNNSALAKQASIEKKLAAKDSKQARKSLSTVKKSIRTQAAALKKLNAQGALLNKAADAAKLQEDKYKALAQLVAQFNSDWAKKAKAAKPAVKKTAAPLERKASPTPVKKINRAPIGNPGAPASQSSSEFNKPLTAERVFDEDSSF